MNETTLSNITYAHRLNLLYWLFVRLLSISLFKRDLISSWKSRDGLRAFRFSFSLSAF